MQSISSKQNSTAVEDAVNATNERFSDAGVQAEANQHRSGKKFSLENTFRPPWFHRNWMSELMGILSGVYDAKRTGFYPGCISLHNGFIPHGPDYETLIYGSKASDDSERVEMMAFMFESARVWHPTKYAKELANDDYVKCWENLETRFFEDTREQKKPM